MLLFVGAALAPVKNAIPYGVPLAFINKTDAP